MENKYKIKYLSSFNDELNEILYYIAYKLKNKNAAENLLNNIENSIIKRQMNPESFETYKSIKNRKYNYYRIYVENYTIFYTVRNNTMEIGHIIYSKRNLKDLI